MSKILPVLVIILLTLVIGVVFSKNIFAAWVLDTVAPVVTLDNPSQPPSCSVTSPSFSIRFNASDALVGVKTVAWELRDSVGSIPPIIPSQDATVAAGSTPNPFGGYNAALWDATIPIISAGTYRIYATATDVAGNFFTNYWTFVFQTQCGTPWIYTTGGDVHSNDSIILPNP